MRPLKRWPRILKVGYQVKVIDPTDPMFDKVAIYGGWNFRHMGSDGPLGQLEFPDGTVAYYEEHQHENLPGEEDDEV